MGFLDPGFIRGTDRFPERGIMPEITPECGSLAHAERDIIEGEDRVPRQGELVAFVRSRNQHTTEADALLRLRQETLLTWKAHRNQLLHMIHDMEP